MVPPGKISLVFREKKMLELITTVNDALNGFMTVPNLIAVFLLTPVVLRLIEEHFRKENL